MQQPFVVNSDVVSDDISDLHSETAPKSLSESEISAIISAGDTHQLISTLRNLQYQLHNSQKRESLQNKNNKLYEQIAEIYPDIIYVYDMVKDSFILSNRNLKSVLGYSDEAEIAHFCGLLTGIMHVDELTNVQLMMETLQTAKDYEIVEVEYRLKSAKEKWMWFHTRCLVLQRNVDGNPEKIVFVTQEITEQKWCLEEMRAHNELICEYSSKLERQKSEMEEINRHLEEMATTDGLTSLKNQRAFQEHLELEFQRAVRYKTPVSLLLMDIDHFKAYNDSFGHPAGDEILQEVASLILENARTSDFVARYGGEEFAVILPNTAKEGAIVMAERFRMAIESAQWSLRAVTCSLGIASLAESVTNRADLILFADKALYASKRNGRNQVCHFDDLH